MKILAFIVSWIIIFCLVGKGFAEDVRKSFGRHRFGLRQHGRETYYEFYPDTDEAPVLEFYFDAPIKDNITRVTPFGVWEGSPPCKYDAANEMQFYTKSYHDAIYSPMKGIVVWMDRRWKTFSIRYGRNYAITFNHIVDIPNNIQLGTKVEEKTLLGYTEHLNGEGWWEIEVHVKRGDIFRSVAPIDFFSSSSQQRLNSILKETMYVEKYTSWTVREGEESWIATWGFDELWTDGNRLGYNRETETREDFARKKGISSMDDVCTP
jgi:hypothetical protein